MCIYQCAFTNVHTLTSFECTPLYISLGLWSDPVGARRRWALRRRAPPTQMHLTVSTLLTECHILQTAHQPHHPGTKANGMTVEEYEAKLGKDLQDHLLHKRQGAKKGKQEMLWENYFPGYASIRARYQRTKMLLNARSKRMGRTTVKDGKELNSKSMANPYIFCKKSFPPNGYYDQAEFHSCLEALDVPKVDLQNLGDSDVATDITGSPAGLHQPDGPGSLSPGSDGWSRW